MKNIINYSLRLLLASVLLISLNSCENEVTNEVLNQQDTITIEYHEEYQVRTTGIHYHDLVENRDVPELGIGGSTSLCPYEDCSTAIPAMGAILQQMANDSCEEVWNCVACCIEGNIAYALMYASPQSPPCSVSSLPSRL
ncbi:MAG: hypothetical protein AB8H03_04300 [Saprospiraceae bacterium]